MRAKNRKLNFLNYKIQYKLAWHILCIWIFSKTHDMENNFIKIYMYAYTVKKLVEHIYISR